MSLLYLDVLDTFRTPVALGNKEEATQRFATGQLMLSLLRGDIPLLSKTQAFDSSIVLSGGRHFRALIKNGDIIVRLYNAESVLKAFEVALDNESFVFSAWPEIMDGSISRTDIKNNLNNTSRLSQTSPDLAERVENLRLIDKAVNDACDKTKAKEPDPSLCDLIRKCTKIAPTLPEKLGQYFDLLKDDSVCNNRSRSHRILDAFPTPEARTTRELVNLFYNRAVAGSLGAETILLTSQSRRALDILAAVLEAGVKQKQMLVGFEIGGISLSRLAPVGWSEVADFCESMRNAPPTEREREAEIAGFVAAIDKPHEMFGILPMVSSAVSAAAVEASRLGAQMLGVHPQPVAALVPVMVALAAATALKLLQKRHRGHLLIETLYHCLLLHRS